jgi:EmrB/QacA subfamily drug resistance transporter
MAIGIWAGVSAMALAIGPLVGGLLTEYVHWSWIFFINVPVGIALIAIAPLLLRESRADLGHRHFDFAGAATVTGGLMLLVYAMTRATQIGWGSNQTISLLIASAALIVSFVVIELRSKAPLLPMRIFRLRTLAGANVTAFLLGTSVFSQFFLGTLYMQQVLGYSAIKTGVAYLPLTLTIVVLAGVAQNLVTKVGVRRVMPVGLALAAGALLLLSQVPPDGHYFFDLFPAFLITAVGLAFTFVPMTIAGLTGVTEEDAGVASGLLNTSQQIGGAIGLAVASTIATTFTAHYATSHPGVPAFSAPALTYGFQIAFYVLAGLAALAAVLAAVLIEPVHAHEADVVEIDAVPAREAA